MSIKEILKKKQLYPVFQPIVDITTGKIDGYEALIRGTKGSSLRNPKEIFEQAKLQNLIVPLEYLCIELACREYQKKQLNGRLFLNVSPMSLTQGHTENHIVEILQSEFGFEKDKVVIELSEQYPLQDYQVIRSAIIFMRECGYELAIDDLGAGYSSLRVWSEFRPEYVKVDRHFIDGINTDPVKYEFVKSIQEISKSLGCKIIAEGIETREELKSIQSLGISHGQGYLLGKPVKKPVVSIPEGIYESINSIQQIFYYPYKNLIIDLLEVCDFLLITDTLEDVAELMKRDPLLNCIPVIKNGIPAGVITRKKVFEIFLGRYGRELHAKKTIKEFLNKNVLIVEKDTSVSDVSYMFTSSNQRDMNIDIIIVDGGKYIGVVKTKKLLEKITENKIMAARHSNPLTMLPGNVPIYEWIDELLSRRHNFKLAYFDLNNFKPYNDIYGYSRGDEIILFLSETIKQNIDFDCDLLGHVGGDDFVVIFQSDDWRKKCEVILDLFEKGVVDYYDNEAIRNNGIYSHDRCGNVCFFSILSVAIGVVSPDPLTCLSHHDVAALATDAKREAKKKGGNTLFISRRENPKTEFIPKINNYGT
jgi:diguanylate cyclase (GGDEF)-like protein